MKKTILFFVALLAIFTLIFSSQERRIRNLNTVIDVRNDTIADLNSQLDKSKQQNQKLKSETSNSDSKKIEDLESQIKDLEQEICDLEEENFELKSSVESQTISSNSTYLAIKFWHDGNNYKVSDDTLKLYKNCFLSKEISGNVTIVSPTISEDKLKNGQTVYSVMTTKGLAYASSYPSLTEVEGNLTAPASSFNEKATKKYIAIKFWQGPDYDRKLYEDSNQYWYSDCYLSNKVQNSSSIVITSENYDSFVLSNKITVYTAYTESGEIVWMRESPSLETIE